MTEYEVRDNVTEELYGYLTVPSSITKSEIQQTIFTYRDDLGLTATYDEVMEAVANSLGGDYGLPDNDTEVVYI